MSEPISEPLPAAEEPRPAHVSALYALLGGRPVLLPIPPLSHGPTKGPLYDEWQKVSWEDTQNHATVLTFSRSRKPEEGAGDRIIYRRENLRRLIDDLRNNLGVLQGAPSALMEDGRTWHLCSIDIDHDEDVAKFLAVNPRLAETLQTVGSRGRNFWVWVEGEYPPLHKDVTWAKPDGSSDKEKAFGEWRSTGGQTVIWGTHPKGMLYRRDVEKPPVRLTFAEIVWPEGLFRPWLPPPKSPAEEAQEEHDALVKEHGKPYEKKDRGGLDINQTFFAAYYHSRHTVVFSPEEKQFYRYEGPATGLWVKQTDDSVRKELAADIKTYADKNVEPRLIVMRTTTLENAITAKIRGFAERWGAWTRQLSPKTNRARAIAHLRDWMLDLDADPPLMVKFAPEFMSRNRIDVALDPKAECPRFLNELLGTALHVDDVRLLRKMAGQILLGVNLAQKIVILTGLEGRGKSTFVKVMQRVIGEVNCGELRTEHLAERFEIFRMLTKSLIVGNDVPGSFLMTEGAYVMKSLVGGDLKDAEPKNGNEGYSIRGEFNILITCNTRLRVKLDGDAGAWRRRLILLPYEAPPPKKKDPFFVENLVASEASGILNWMIAGAVDLLADLAEFGDVQLTKAQKDRVESLLAESDSVRDFARRGCAKGEESDKVTSEDALAAYVAWCERRGWSPMPSKRVEQMLPDALLEIHGAAKSNDIKRYPGDKAKRGYRGLRLLGAGGGDVGEGTAASDGAETVGDDMKEAGAQAGGEVTPIAPNATQGHQAASAARSADDPSDCPFDEEDRP